MNTPRGVFFYAKHNPSEAKELEDIINYEQNRPHYT